MIWTTIHPFLWRDRTHIEPMIRHLQSAAVDVLVLTVPWRATLVRSQVEPDFTPALVWRQVARRFGMPIVWHVGPAFSGGWPAWGWPDHVWASSPSEREAALLTWWRALQAALEPDAVMLSFHSLFPSEVRERLRAFWHSVSVEDEASWYTLDVRDLEWQEWEFDTSWWARVGASVTRTSVRVQAWWLGRGRDGPLPVADTVHEALDGPFVRALLTSLWANGASRVWWDPICGGIRTGWSPLPPWETMLDGGVPFRAWGASTDMWSAFKRMALSARVLRIAEMRWTHTSPVEIQGDVEFVGYGQNTHGGVLAVRRLPPGETRVCFHIPARGLRACASLTGPGGWLFPVNWEILQGQGKVFLTTGDVVWHGTMGDREIWIVDAHRGAEWIMHLPGKVAYETGATVRPVDEGMWHVVFDPGQQGQVLWRSGSRLFHLVAVDEVMGNRVWPPEPGRPYLVLGPQQWLGESGDEREKVLRVSTERPVGMLFVHRAPLRVEVVETGKASVWGARTGMGGVRLGGPKEWGAPRVSIPELEWDTRPWDGPSSSAAWGEISLDGRPFSAGWHWFQRIIPSSLREITLTVRGICDVWLGDTRIAGVRSPDAPRQRTFRLPDRSSAMPLTLILWVPPASPHTQEVRPGYLVATTEDASGDSVWRYRLGVCGVDTTHQTIYPETACGVPSESGTAFWLHRARFDLDVPEGVWVQFGLALGDVGEWVWVFLNRVMVGQWWSGWSRESVLWLAPDILQVHGSNELLLLQWPRGREHVLPRLALQQLHRERVWHLRVVPG